MDFIYRIPLLEFDPKDDAKITQHWEDIKSRIRESSPSLFAAVQNKPFDMLDEEIRLTVYKYLLRGKYRSTPFGRWAAVGTASWSNKSEYIFPLLTEEIVVNTDREEIDSFVLAQAIDIQAERIKYWFYDSKDEKWAYGIIYPNKLINLITNHYKSEKTLTYQQFSTWFVNIDAATVRGMWQETLETGLIQKISTADFDGYGKTNLKSTHRIQLDSEIRDQLDSFLDTAGSLFKVYQRPLLMRFIWHFHRRYDDRFVSLDKLIHDEDIFESTFGGGNEHAENQSVHQLQQPTSHVQQINLREFNGTKLPDEVQDIQVLFHLGSKSEIIVDNIVCNRPFVFTGRFTDDPEIHEIARKSAPKQYPTSPIHCDIELIESETIRFLTRHQNVFSHVLSPISTGSKDEIPLSELYLGTVDNTVVLVWKTKNRDVVPVFQHPLNGSQITHHLFRLLWEISNQYPVKFLPYLQTSARESSYSPELRWDRLVLQPKKWSLTAQACANKTALLEWLKDRSVSTPALAGIEDKELVLDWSDKRDLDLMWQELAKRRQLTLLDASSIKLSPFRNAAGESLHPQFVYHRRFQSLISRLPETVNYLEESDPRCLYFRITAPASTLLILMKEVLPHLITRLEELKAGLRWYFVRYSRPEEELRLRFRDIDPGEVSRIQSTVDRELFSILQSGNYFRTAHHPEYHKYSRESLNISESIFHFESVLMIFGYPPVLDPLMHSSEVFRVRVVSEIWTAVFMDSGRGRTYLVKLKSMLKSITTEEMRQIRETFDSEIVSLNMRDITALYLDSIRSHLWHQTPGRQKILLLNHFHMTVNRLFPDHTAEYEDACRYLTYRKLGRAIHSRPAT
jgi:thiopeptide-type bacteriocin biosynthesis protein